MCWLFVNLKNKKFPDKSVWKIHGALLLVSFRKKIFRSNENIWKSSPVFPDGTFQTEKKKTVSGCSGFFFGKIQWFVQMVNHRVFSHDVTAAILVSQNNETAAMLVSRTNPMGVELFFISYGKVFFCSNKFAQMLATWVKTLYQLLNSSRLESAWVFQRNYRISSGELI